MPSQLDVVNQIRAKIGRKPVTNILDDDDSQIIAQQLPLFTQALLLKAPWTFATKYFFNDTPNTSNIETNPLYPPYYQNNFELPADYGRFFRFQGLNTPTFGMDYMIIDGVMQTNTSFIALYYIVSNVDLSVITAPFYEALVYYGAASVALALTNNEKLAQWLWVEYEQKIADAIQQNWYEMEIVQTPYNDFDRQTYI